MLARIWGEFWGGKPRRHRTWGGFRDSGLGCYGFVSRPWPTQALGMMADGAIASRARAVKPRGRSRALHILYIFSVAFYAAQLSPLIHEL